MYDPVIQGQRREFGVSGALYKRNLLFYDRETLSLWSQLLGRAVTGRLAGARLEVLPAENSTWGAWKQEHPQTLVLSFATGQRRDYRQDPYAGYSIDRRQALLVTAGGAIRLYPFSELKKSPAALSNELAGHRFTIRFERPSETARVESRDPAVRWFVSFLHDLRAFYRQAEVYKAGR